MKIVKFEFKLELENNRTDYWKNKASRYKVFVQTLIPSI